MILAEELLSTGFSDRFSDNGCDSSGSGGFGGEFLGPARVQVEDVSFPGIDGFGHSDLVFDEQHPIVKAPYDRNQVNVILSLHPDSVPDQYREKRGDDDFPLAWSKSYGTGRVFQMGWSHRESTWDDPRFQTMMLQDIQWAMGCERSCRRPVDPPSGQ